MDTVFNEKIHVTSIPRFIDLVMFIKSGESNGIYTLELFYGECLLLFQSVLMDPILGQRVERKAR